MPDSPTTKEVPPRPRKERERERRTLELLEVAGQIFAARGFHRASMEDIARSAEYATGALYRYFESKEVLYTAVLEKKMEELLAYIGEQVGGTTDPVESLRRSVRAQWEFASRNRAFIQIYFRERMEITRAGAHWKRVDDLVQELIDWRAQGVALGQTQGVFRAGEPRLYALALEGMISGLVRDWLVRDPNRPMDDQADFIIDLGLRAILTQP